MANEFNKKDFSFDDKVNEYALYYKKGKGESFKEKMKSAFKDENGNNSSKSFFHNLFEWLDVIVVSVIVVTLVFTFLFRIVAIDGDSMLNTLHNGERVIISDLFYTPKYGDIVVISRNTENLVEQNAIAQPIIKRVIATEGQTVDINFETGLVSVDGVVLNEPYVKDLTYRRGDVTFPVRVPENCVFVLGDNRNDSSDSRYSDLGKNGMVDEKYILGKAILRISPVKKFGGLYTKE